VAVTDGDLIATRGPTGRAQIARLLSIARIAEAFRAQHHRWATDSDLDIMTLDHEPRLLAAAATPLPNADACDALRRLHAQGIRTAVICCTPRRLLGPQLQALARANIPIDCLVTADEACEPAPAPWGVFEAIQRLGIASASELVLIDDSPAGAIAARNAGARAVSFISNALISEGQKASPNTRETVHSLAEICRVNGPTAPPSSQ
jgi:beta-phosphoglucomutase-like phosphatase (HAD superfamily)